MLKPVNSRLRKKNILLSILLLAIIFFNIAANYRTILKTFRKAVHDYHDGEAPLFLDHHNISFEEEFDRISRAFPRRYCDIVPFEMREKLNIEQNVPEILNPFQLYLDKEVISNYTIQNKITNNLYFESLLSVKHGGHWAPSHCRPRHRVAIIIPYRDREENLNSFLYNMHPFLMRQELNYTIFAVEQINNVHFNKGILMNAAFREIILKNLFDMEFDCVLYHDVDLLPSDELNMYTCPFRRPKHLSILVDDIDYRKSYPILVGGVMFYRIPDFLEVNGYSNKYWGWGQYFIKF